MNISTTGYKLLIYNLCQALNNMDDRMYVKKKDEKSQCFETKVLNPTKYIEIPEVGHVSFG